MSKGSIFLRSEADKCLLLAKNIGDARTQGELRALAGEYVQRADDIESKEKADPAAERPPSNNINPGPSRRSCIMSGLSRL
jgi:hypothetical protein